MTFFDKYAIIYINNERKVSHMLNILVVEDDSDLNNIVCSFLNRNGFNAVGCENPVDAYSAMNGRLFDLIISDIMMPGIDGFEFAKNIRRVNSDLPIIFLTARDDFTSKERGFKAGVDDYIVKPVDLDELLLRIGALLRRAHISQSKKIELPHLVLDADELSATIDGEEVPVTLREFNILFKLLSYPKRTFSRSQLMDEFWGLESETTLRSVDVYITKLRDKFSSCPDFKIVTIHGLGYKAVLQ